MAELGVFEYGVSAVVGLLTTAFGVVWKRQDRHEDKDEAMHDDIWAAINTERTKLSDHKTLVAKDYITKDDFNRLEGKIDRLLETRA